MTRPRCRFRRARAAACLVAAAALSSFGCSRPAEPPAAAERAEPAPAARAAAERAEPAPASCQARADQLARFLTTMDHEPAFFTIADDLRLLDRADLERRTAMAPVIEVTPVGIRFEGRSSDPAALASALAASHAEARRSLELGYGGPDFDPARVHIAVDERAPWSAVVAAAEAGFDAGFASPSFVFSRPPATEPPPRSPIDDQLDAIEAQHPEPSARATAIAQVFEGLVGRCPSLIRLFGQVATARDKAAFLLAGVGPALVECDCQVDIPSLRSALWRVAGNPRPLSFASVPLARDGRRLSFPAEAPWAEAAAAFGAKAGPTWLVVGGR